MLSCTIYICLVDYSIVINSYTTAVAFQFLLTDHFFKSYSQLDWVLESGIIGSRLYDSNCYFDFCLTIQFFPKLFEVNLDSEQ